MRPGAIAAAIAILASWTVPASALPMASATATPTHAASEFALGFTTFVAPRYPGSDSYQRFVYPLVSFSYNGPLFSVKRNRFKSAFTRAPRLTLGLGANASPPVSSSAVAARQGMPDIDPTIQIGPSLQYRVTGKARPWQGSVGAAWELVFATSPHLSRIHHAGSLFYPYVQMEWHAPTWPITLTTGPLFGSHGYNNYFFGVPDAYATGARPAYASPSGYAGTRTTASLSHHFKRYWLAAFVRYRNFSGTRFADSPLLKNRNTVMLGVAVEWTVVHWSQP